MIEICLCILAIAYRRSRDSWLVRILILAALARILMGGINIEAGPLPGAEYDAVTYEQTASQFATQYHETGHFDLEFGRLGYASIISVPYILAGHNRMLPTFVNLIFALHFIYLAYMITRMFRERHQARLVALGAAFWPFAIIYSAVPLRESILMWGLAMWLYGMCEFFLDRGRLLNPRSLIGLVIAGWLHTGFFFLAPLMAFVWWAKGVRAKSEGKGWAGQGLLRLAGIAVLLAAVFVIFVKFGGAAEKLPSDPTQVNLNYLNSLRAVKASYGTGYAGYAPTRGLAFIASIPKLVYYFLFSPTPLDVARSGNIAEAIKGMDSVAFLVLVSMCLTAVRCAVRQREKALALLVGGVLTALVLLFAVGTANVGIAIRHRSKFAWLFVLFIALWRPHRVRKEATRELSDANQPANLAA